MIFRQAFHLSCVPCYQQVARRIGQDTMRAYLDKLAYGDMKVDSASLDRFWLVGDSKINPFEQIDFLRRFYQSELPISPRTEDLMRELLVIERSTSHTLSGKTGWAIRDGNNNGWFVGYVENSSGTYFVATNVVPSQAFDMDLFAVIRRDITEAALRQLHIIE